MPVSYSFHDNIVIINTAGNYSTDDLKDCLSRALSDAACPPGAVMLFDMREDTAVLERKKEEIREMSFFIGDIKDRFNARLCMVTQTGLSYGLMHMATVFDESLGIDCKVFTDYDEAMAWLREDGGK